MSIAQPPESEGGPWSYRVGWLEALPYPARSALRRWRELIGMIVGVGIALGVTMTLVAVSRGSVDYYTSDLVRAGAQLFVVAEGGTMIPVLPSDSPGTIKHGTATLARLRSLPAVTAALGFMSWPMVREQEGPRRPDAPKELVTVVGIDGDIQGFPRALALVEGRWIRAGNEVVLGTKLSSEKGLKTGDTVRLARRSFNVVGIGKLRGMGAGVMGDTVAYMDYRAFRERAEIGDVVSVVLLNTSQPQIVRERVIDMDDLTAFTTDELAMQAEEANAAGVGIRLVIVVLTLAIAALFVNSMLSHSVSERRAEFATLRAIGIPSRTVLLVVASEAVLISTAAGVVGILVSLALGGFIDRVIATSYGIESLYSADAGLFALVFAVAIGLGIVSGLLPARRATQVDPIEVLREV